MPAYKKLPVFGEDGVLSLKTTGSGIDGIALKDGENKVAPYVTRTDINNGIVRFISDCNYESGSDDGNVITIGLDTQTAFYQPHRFVTGQNIQIAASNNLDEDTALFLAVILRNQLTAKFNWGGNGATIGRLRRLDALLPVTDDDRPDYDYMRTHTEEIRIRLLKQYHDYAERRLEELGVPADIPSLHEVLWKPFLITELFASIEPGRGNGLVNMIRTTAQDGIQYIGATNRNNGVLCFVERNDTTQKMIQPGNCIGFIKNGDGSAGYAIYKATEFISTTDVIFGYADWLNEYTGLFFVAAQDMIKSKYSHGYKRNRKHISGDRVMLPTDDSGEPDFGYMEQYSKNLMIGKYQQYCGYLNRNNLLEGGR